MESSVPRASRPHMPSYGILPADEGTGLLPWSWARQRLIESHDYWLASVRPEGRPHVMPVWGVWMEEAVWFSCSPTARKAVNMAASPAVTITTDNARQPVVVDGRSVRVTDAGAVRAFADAVALKYDVGYPVEFFVRNATFVVRPETVIGLTDEDFAGSPTRWTF